MDPASIIADLASAHFSLSQVAARHGLSLDALAAFITSDQTQQRLDELQSAAAISTRLAAQLHLPIAVAALGTLLARHRAVACTSTPQSNSTPSREARSPSDDARSPSDDARSSRAEARALRHQVELRRAAATLLRCANFNHRARTNTLARDTQPQLASTPSANPRGSAAHTPPSVNTPANLTHAFNPRHSAAHARPQSVDVQTAPTATTPSIHNESAHPAAPAPSPLLTAPVSTPFTAQQSPLHFPSFAELFAAAVASMNSADDSGNYSADDGLGDAVNADAQASSPDSTTSPPAVNVPALTSATPSPLPPSVPAPSSSTTPPTSHSPAPSTAPAGAPTSTTPHAARFSNTRLSSRRSSAAQRLATSAGASTHPP
ncbi:MAG: hypothetical protein KF859_11060 [Phycisphaeraceae bacterium]|nr:hypothetical protein [Phycisphaeraceae bacterium]